MKTKPRLRLTGKGGNAFVILARAQKTARKAGWTPDGIENYLRQAKAGNYDNPLRVTMEYFDVG